MNDFALYRFPGKLCASNALKSEMQKRGAVYLNLDNDLEYKSLYGEKNPF